MLRLRCCLLTQLLSSPSASPASHLRRLFSAAAPAVSPNPSFAVEEYLVATCGLTRPQALKASAKLSHLKSPSNPDAVLAILAGLGLSSADVAALVAKDPQFLCAKVERTLAPVVAGLTGLGLSRSDIAHLVSLSRDKFRCRSFVSNLQYFLHLFGSFENLLPALRRGSCFLSADLETVVKPNVAFLRSCGLGDCDIAKLCMAQLMLLGSNIECVRAMAARAQDIGVPCGSRMFRHALQAVAFLSNEKIAAKVEHLKKMFRWSDVEVRIALSTLPPLLMRSNHMLESKSEFLISKVGFEPAYIAHHPALLTYSLEGRIIPRYYVVKFLKENGLLDHNRSYYSAVIVMEKVFVDKYISPHKEVAPYLAEDYDAACRGEVPTRFKFT
ncbi:hypothetical protein CFC21_086529 [Triticum aestivum]|uniref:Uncharacterized protein n=2 Tax=Triticum aestivum TaxID=4565 RepID=A0A9R1IFB8_WHEAT|nr:uncharacterized protein LOC123135749 [Triticum aestivum]XP_044410890.1 uncharacterized protein LOC123135749 [Triticum aestivum]KAF7082673.1 hypothetical protein CFC21_086529 [Triticum aestivum]